MSDNYPLAYDTRYLPAGVNVNPIPTPTVVTFNGGPQLNAPKFASYSWMGSKMFNITAPVVWLNNGGVSLLGGTLEDFTTHGQDFTGKIALIRRGTYNFSVKQYNAQLAGAVAVVVYVNPGQTAFNAAILGAYNLQTPFVMIGSDDGLNIINQITVNPNLTMTISGKFPIKG